MNHDSKRGEMLSTGGEFRPGGLRKGKPEGRMLSVKAPSLKNDVEYTGIGLPSKKAVGRKTKEGGKGEWVLEKEGSAVFCALGGKYDNGLGRST